jgi:hypothetical protein
VHIFTVWPAGGVLVEPPVGAGSPGAMAGAAVFGAGSPTAMPVAGVGPPRSGGASTQVQAAGQSVSAVQLFAFGVQAPTVLVLVVHMVSGGTGALELAGALEALPEPVADVATPDPALPPPEQAVVVANAQEKPSPQSASAWQGSCQVYAHIETLFVVHVGGVEGAKHCAFGGQVEPPEHAWYVSVWQTIVGPQSASVAHEASTHVPLVAG